MNNQKFPRNKLLNFTYKVLIYVECVLILGLALIILFIGFVLFGSYLKIVFCGETEWTRRVSEPVAKMINLLGQNWRVLIVLIPLFLITIKKVIQELKGLFRREMGAIGGKERQIDLKVKIPKGERTK